MYDVIIEYLQQYRNTDLSHCISLLTQPQTRRESYYPLLWECKLEFSGEITQGDSNSSLPSGTLRSINSQSDLCEPYANFPKHEVTASPDQFILIFK